MEPFRIGAEAYRAAQRAIEREAERIYRQRKVEDELLAERIKKDLLAWHELFTRLAGYRRDDGPVSH